MTSKEFKQKEQLILLRSELISKLHWQPFKIYGDDVIDNLIKLQPKTMEELYKVKGFPKTGKRIENFGEAIIEIFNPTNRIKNFKVEIDNTGNANIKIIMQPMSIF